MADKPSKQPPKGDQHAEADKAALEAKPDEARMAALAKRMMGSMPRRQVAPNALEVKRRKVGSVGSKEG